MSRATRKRAREEINKQNRMMKSDEEKLDQALRFKYPSGAAHTQLCPIPRVFLLGKKSVWIVTRNGLTEDELFHVSDFSHQRSSILMLAWLKFYHI